MKTYEIKVNCEYYVEVEAESKDEALELAIEAEYELHDLQHFEYTVVSESKDYEADEDDE